MSFRVKLADDREVTLHELRQVLTYSGAVGGPPTTSINRNIVEQLSFDPQNHIFGQVPHVIPPVEKLLELREPLGYGIAAVLPAVKCIGRFESHRSTKGEPGYTSVLVVAWFQDNFAMPVDPKVLELIQRLNWSELATDHEW